MKTVLGVILLAIAVPPWQFSAKKLRASKVQNAPAKAASLRNPYAGRPEAVKAGQKLFERHCAACHGASAQGLGKAPGLRSAQVQAASPGALFWFLTNGNPRAGMPSWSSLPEQRRWQIVAYLQSLGPHRPTPPR